MFLPIGDEPNPRGAPWVGWLLMGANVAVYLLIALPLSVQPVDPRDALVQDYLQALQDGLGRGGLPPEWVAHISRYDLYLFAHGYVSARPSLQDLFSSMFLHAGLAHLLGNMLMLWIFGDNIEARLGRLGYLAAYLATGMLGMWTHGALSGPSLLPAVGASGAISGVLGLYFVLYPHNRVRVLVLLFPIFMRVVKIRARWVLGAFLVLDNLLPMLLQSKPGGVAYGAHLGGFLGGALLGKLLPLLEMRRRSPEPHLRDGAGGTGEPSSADAIHGWVLSGRLDLASRAYVELWRSPERRHVQPQDALAVAQYLASKGEREAAMAIYQRLIVEDGVRGPHRARAHAGAGLLLLHAFGRPTEAYQQFMTAQRHNPDPQLTEEIQAALQEIAQVQKLKFRGV